MQQSSDLKRLVRELEQLLAERGGLLDAPARLEFEERIERLKRAVDQEDATAHRRLAADALEILAALLSVITNMMSLLK